MATLVTGASSGIGAAVAKRLEEDGVREVLTLDKHGDDVMIRADVTKLVELKDALRNENIDEVVNCAGVNYLMRFEELNMDKANYVMAINLWGAVKVTYAVLGQLVDNRGLVCNVISSAARKPMRYSLAYNVSKAGLEMATRQLAHELGPRYGVTVFGVSPSLVKGTAMTTKVNEQLRELRGWTEDQVAEHNTEQPLYPEDVADYIHALMDSRGDADQNLAGLILPYGGVQM